MPTVILANRYNVLRDRVNKVLGISPISEPTFGYGQTINDINLTGSRTSIVNADKITAQQYRDLYIDLIRTRIHQVGSSSVTIEPFVVGNYEVNTTNTDKVEESYISALEALATNIENDRFLIDTATQAQISTLTNSSGNPLTSSRLQSSSGVWNGTIDHIVDVEFSNAANRRHFFNSGGQIRLNASVNYTGTQQKTLLWKSALSSMGTISFTANNTFSNVGVGLNTSIGNYQLTSSYQLCYRQTAGGVYSNNYYEIYALSLSNSTIRIKVNFTDGAPLNTINGVDEPVLGDFTSTFQTLSADGSATINGVTTNTVVFSGSVTGTTVSSL